MYKRQDLVAATLILAAQKRADGLAQILSGLAESVSAEVAARRHLELSLIHISEPTRPY